MSIEGTSNIELPTSNIEHRSENKEMEKIKSDHRLDSVDSALDVGRWTLGVRRSLTRRQFFARSANGIGTVALASLLNPQLFADEEVGQAFQPDMLPQKPSQENRQAGKPDLRGERHFPPRAKRVIYLFMHGGPSQMELFDYKPLLWKVQGTELPDSVRGSQRLTGMTSNQKSFPIAAPRQFTFKQHGQSGAWVSDLMPNLAQVSDEICFVKSLNTEAINHDPAVTLLQTGHQAPERDMVPWPTP